MKKNLFAILLIFSIVTISMGCSDKKEAPMGFTPQQIEALGPKMFAKLCSADCVRINAGTFFAAGAKSRVGGNWNAPPCSTFVTTTDGAQRQFVASCTCTGGWQHWEEKELNGGRKFRNFKTGNVLLSTILPPSPNRLLCASSFFSC